MKKIKLKAYTSFIPISSSAMNEASREIIK